MISKVFNIDNLDRLIYVLLYVYVALSCTEALGAMHFLRSAVCLGIIRFIIKPVKINIKTKHFWYIAFFLLTILFTIVVDGGNYVNGFKLLRLDYLATMLPMAVILLFIKKEQIKNLLLCLMVSLFITNCYALWQAFQGINRVEGFSGGYMQMGGILILLVPLTVLLLFNNDGMLSVYRPFLLLNLVIEIPVIFFNGTRITWIALLLIIPLVVFTLGKNTKKNIFYCASIAILFIGIGNANSYVHERLNSFFDKSYQSNSERVLMWQSAGRMLFEYPLTGVGLGNYKEQYQTKYISPEAKERTLIHAHSNIMHLAASAGFLGAGAYLIMFGYFLYESFTKWRYKKTIPPLIFFCATLGFLIQGLTDYNIGVIGVACKVYWMLMAIYLVFDGAVSIEDR